MKKGVLVGLAVFAVASVSFGQQPTYCATQASRDRHVSDKGHSWGKTGAAVGGLGGTAWDAGMGAKEALSGDWGGAAGRAYDARDNADRRATSGYNVGRSWGESSARRDIERNCDYSIST